MAAFILLIQWFMIPIFFFFFWYPYLFGETTYLFTCMQSTSVQHREIYYLLYVML